MCARRWYRPQCRRYSHSCNSLGYYTLNWPLATHRQCQMTRHQCQYALQLQCVGVLPFLSAIEYSGRDTRYTQAQGAGGCTYEEQRPGSGMCTDVRARSYIFMYDIPQGRAVLVLDILNINIQYPTPTPNKQEARSTPNTRQETRTPHTGHLKPNRQCQAAGSELATSQTPGLHLLLLALSVLPSAESGKRY